ncbi:OmpA family protein [Xylanibacter caecicola]|uniref:OmpA family protein n=1 Tax=Xylanibacter caecicola TaxID=2736294 RepID=UPI00258B2882|nr:OmpA family protein [Xylanibacter caecicola]
MRKLLFVLAFAGISVASMAQNEDATEKYSVSTNSFWSNWFIQAGAQWQATYFAGEHGEGFSKSPLKSFRSNPQASVAIGKWFTPGLGLRIKASGIWGKAAERSYKFWNGQGQALFNLSNMLCGYNPDRVYNFIPFAGAGVARNCTDNLYVMGLSVGILNQFNISKKVAVNLELGWNRMENDFVAGGTAVNMATRFWDSHTNVLYAEVGLTYNLGKATWNKTPDVDAIKALSQSQIDALNAQLADEKAEIDRLKTMLANQKPAPAAPAVTKSIKEFITTPVSVFFNISKTDVANPKDLVNVKALAKYAKENNSNILVTGYADSSTGTPAINQKLSENRANQVVEELVKMGVSRDKISTAAKGGVKELGVESPVSFDRRATVQIVE